MILEMIMLSEGSQTGNNRTTMITQRPNLNHHTTALIHETDFKKKLMAPKGEKIGVKKDKGMAGGT